MFKCCVILFSVILIIIVVFPILNIFLNLDFGNFFDTLLGEEFLKAVLVTFSASVISVGMILILGIPFSYMIARYDFPFKTLIEALVDLPQSIPNTAAGIALLLALGRTSATGRFLENMGLKFSASFLGVTVAIFYVSFSIFVSTVKEGFRELDIRYEKVARSLGKGEFETFFKVSIPMVKKEIIAGTVQMWARGISTFGAVAIIAYNPKTLSVLAYDKFLTEGVKESLSVVAGIFLVFGSVFLLLRTLENRWKSEEMR
ncbi:ABC transporter permease [Thermosipho ferrireducens]|uniref:ABC transporter permease n=1 Tax=Thermosipho ferrireducens TaxID=2571116 RepID=A0ABX7S8V6_9BACT|nr:ABC transporter permease [Thermosipho ferrireducens]QTA38363.1 ABC transporter permease [Thermosipho ferrireducens]